MRAMAVTAIYGEAKAYLMGLLGIGKQAIKIPPASSRRVLQVLLIELICLP